MPMPNKRYYCEVKGIEKSFTSGLKIIFDFGTEASYNMWGDLSSKLKFVDEKGKEIDFNSMVDAAIIWCKEVGSFSKPILLYMEEVLSFIGFSSRMQKIWNRRKRAF